MTTNCHHAHRFDGRTPARPPRRISPPPPTDEGEGQWRDFPETIRALNPRTGALPSSPSPPRSRGGLPALRSASGGGGERSRASFQFMGRMKNLMQTCPYRTLRMHTNVRHTIFLSGSCVANSSGEFCAKFVGLLSELAGIGFLELRQVLEFPPDRRQLRKLRELHQAPVRFTRDEAQQKLPLICRQRSGQILLQTPTSLPTVMQTRVQSRLDEMSLRLESFQHYRLVGSTQVSVTGRRLPSNLPLRSCSRRDLLGGNRSPP